jgi:hypothetical protein
VNLIWHSYYENGNLPGNQVDGSFWWRSHLKLVDCFKVMARCNFGDGKSVQFWSDLWQDSCLHHKLPHLLSFAKRTYMSVHDVIQTEYLEDLFHLPLSHQAFQEFQQFEIICQQAMDYLQ